MLEIDRIANERVSDDELNAAKEALKGSFGRSLERPNTLASFALNVSRYGLEEDHYEKYLIRLAAVTAEDVQRVAQKYLHSGGYRIMVVGKSSEIADGLKAFGELTYYDFEGNITDPPIDIPEGVTVSSILDNYLEALGGAEKLRAVKTLEIKREASIQGLTLSSTEVFEFPKAYQQLNMGPMGVIELVKKEEGFVFLQNGTAVPLPEDQSAEMESGLEWIPELNYTNDGVERKIAGIDQMNGKTVYMIENVENGKSSFDFYEAESGLKVRTQETQEGPSGESVTVNVDYKEYTDFGGIMFPKIIGMPLGLPMNTDFEITEVKINEKVDSSVFSKG
jgi:hypothetical protein